MRKSIVVALASGLIAGTLTQRAQARPVPTPRGPIVVYVDSPIGDQVRGAGNGNIAVSFHLFEARGRPCDVEVEYGIDLNGDGRVTDGPSCTSRAGACGFPFEYRPATEDVSDPRDSRHVNPLLAPPSKPRQFPSQGRVSGSTDGRNVFVWKSAADLPRQRLPLLESVRTAQGRLVPDPDNPGGFLRYPGPAGNFWFSGVKLRFRAKLRGGRPSPWIYTDTFGLDNTSKPSMTIDAVTPNAAGSSVMLVNWTAFHPDSEDLNGNGVLDIASGEDMNGNGMLDPLHVGVAFDWHRLAPGEDPTTMTPAQLAALSWSPCTRETGVGDTDSLDARPGVPIPTSGELAGVACAPFPVGRHWVFAWDSAADVGATTDAFILRAAPFDERRSVGATYSTIVVRPGQ